MARILAIDYGGKRSGIAVTDPLQIIANGLTTIESATIITWLDQYFKKEEVELVLVGLPKSLRNEETHGTALVEKFLKAFREKFPERKILTLDERFTSKMAFQTMIDSGLKKKDRRNKALVDEISAVILLQYYMAGPSFS